MALEIETRVALLEMAHETTERTLHRIEGNLVDFQTETRKSNARIIGWLIGACFTLTCSSVLLAMNLVK